MLLSSTLPLRISSPTTTRPATQVRLLFSPAAPPEEKLSRRRCYGLCVVVGRSVGQDNSTAAETQGTEQCVECAASNCAQGTLLVYGLGLKVRH